MEKIRAGVLKFQSEVFPQKRELYEQAASTQRPHSLFVTCTDSRVDPEGLTQSEPGDISVERNPGNLIPSYSLAALGGVSASVEYAVSILKVRHIVVCGHSNCGGMNGIL